MQESDAFRHLNDKQKRFLVCFSACASVIQASRWAKIHRDSHYGWMETSEAYAAEFRKAQPKAARALQDEAVRRAHQGVRKAVYYKGKIVGWETEFSDMLMAKMLDATDPETFRHRTDTRHSGPDGGPVVDPVAFMAAFRKKRSDDAKSR